MTSLLSPQRRIEHCRRQLARLDAESFPSTTRAERKARLLTAWQQAEAEAATVRCSRCGAPLTEPASVARGMGECCAAKAAS